LAAMLAFFIHCWREWRKLTPEERRKAREEIYEDPASRAP